MPFYEIIYETGNHSLAYYEDDTEAQDAVQTHHDRATTGQPAQASNPEMGPAERIVKVLKYDEHPGTLNESQAVNSEDVKTVINEAVVGNLVSVPEIAAKVRDISNPMVDSPAHESNYKMEEVGELEWQ